MALHLEDRQPIVDVMERTPSIPDACQWALFLRNHDELTLEIASPTTNATIMYLAYSVDPQARLKARRFAAASRRSSATIAAGSSC